MRSRNLDRISVRQWRTLAHIETVGDMIRAKWDVVSKCPACGLEMQAQLEVIARISGPDTSLWNRRPPCRRRLCQGRVDFWAKPPGRTAHEPLSPPDDP
jgi:hypothetical protein